MNKTKKFMLGAAIAALVFCGSCSTGYLYENVKKSDKKEHIFWTSFIIAKRMRDFDR